MMRSLAGGSAGLPDAFGQIGSRFGKSCSVPGEHLLVYLLGDCAPRKQLRPSSDVKSATKGRKTLATKHVEKVQWHRWTHQPVRQKSSKNARVYEFLLRAPLSSIPAIVRNPSYYSEHLIGDTFQAAAYRTWRSRK
jgi:hypothetical protein